MRHRTNVVEKGRDAPSALAAVDPLRCAFARLLLSAASELAPTPQSVEDCKLLEEFLNASR